MLPATLVTLATFLLELSSSSPVYNMQPAFITNNIGSTAGRNIRNLPCISRRNNGLRGVCMFAIDCLKANGTHLGTCIDRFYFGSCCHIERHHDIVDNTIDDVVLDSREPPMRLSSTIRPITTTRRYSASATTTKPPTRTTIKTTTVSTNASSVSTTTKQPAFGDKIETTTPPQKLQTFQSVEGLSSSTKYTTTPPIPTKVTKITTTTRRTTTKPSSSKPVVVTTTPTTSRPVPSKQPVRTTTKPTKPTRTTTKSTTPTRKPATTTKVQTTTKKPGTTITKPTKQTTTTKKTATKAPKPTSSTTNLTTTSSSTPVTTTKKPVTTSGTTTSTTTVSNEVASKVNATSEVLGNPATNEIETVKPAVVSSTTIGVSSSTTPSTTAGTISSTTPSTTAGASSSTTASTSTTSMSSGTTTSMSSSTTTSMSSSTTISTSSSTMASTSSTVSTSTSSTVKPALVSWTVADNKNHTSTVDNEVVESTEDWIPITTPDGWVLLPSLPPVSSSNDTNTTTSSTPLTLPTTSSTSTTTPTPSASPASSTTSPPTSVSTSSTGTSTEMSTAGQMSTESTPSSTSSTVAEVDKLSSTTEIIIVNITESNQTTTSTTETNLTEVSEKPAVNMSDFTDVCGRRMFPEARIVGGEKSPFGRWPWQISLRQWRTSTYLHKCGAALLNENWAITAAHCVDNVPPSDLLLRLGEHDLSTEAEPYLHQERRVQIVASHPQFDPRTFEYDLALLRFYEPVQFQPNILPVCVPQTDENFVGRTAYVTGWGRLYEDGPLPSVLQEVSVPVINNSVCESMYRSAGYIEHIPHIFICAGWRRGGFDSCEGDSGGPMVIQRDDGRFLLAGVISWGIGCAEPNQPGVYTRISEFRDWINQILQF